MKTTRAPRALFPSMRGRDPRISCSEFEALIDFERLHPDLFRKNRRRRASDDLGDFFSEAISQANAFNAVFCDPVWGKKVKLLLAKRRGEAR